MTYNDDGTLDQYDDTPPQDFDRITNIDGELIQEGEEANDSDLRTLSL
jgi:hypothetical protein